ncbi:aspartate 1-decarboxylase [bacterium]|jgi:aspartate 1-decarboxylase|nr:aspartate 1-decarboxylase [bacterium]
MKIKLLKSKIHRATVTDACLDYEGSISIDQTLLKASNILPYESVQVLNVTNGNRLETYALPSNKKGEICINGAAAHLVNPKDIVIIVSYVHMTVDEAKSFKPSLVYPNEANEI